MSRSAPLNNLNVRLAMQCAISRQQVINTAALGEGTPIGPITSPAYKSDPNSQPCATQNVAKAKTLRSSNTIPGIDTRMPLTEAVPIHRAAGSRLPALDRCCL